MYIYMYIYIYIYNSKCVLFPGLYCVHRLFVARSAWKNEEYAARGSSEHRNPVGEGGVQIKRRTLRDWSCSVPSTSPRGVLPETIDMTDHSRSMVPMKDTINGQRSRGKLQRPWSSKRYVDGVHPRPHPDTSPSKSVIVRQNLPTPWSVAAPLDRYPCPTMPSSHVMCTHRRSLRLLRNCLECRNPDIGGARRGWVRNPDNTGPPTGTTRTAYRLTSGLRATAAPPDKRVPSLCPNS